MLGTRFFFKLSVIDCGRFFKLDNCTVAKDRFDYARIFLATTSLDVINFTKSIIIDGELVELKIIEEWGFALGEDACLLEEDDIVSNDYDKVADLVNKLADEMGRK